MCADDRRLPFPLDKFNTRINQFPRGSLKYSAGENNKLEGRSKLPLTYFRASDSGFAELLF